MPLAASLRNTFGARATQPSSVTTPTPFHVGERPRRIRGGDDRTPPLCASIAGVLIVPLSPAKPERSDTAEGCE